MSAGAGKEKRSEKSGPVEGTVKVFSLEKTTWGQERRQDHAKPTRGVDWEKKKGVQEAGVV